MVIKAIQKWVFRHDKRDKSQQESTGGKNTLRGSTSTSIRLQYMQRIKNAKYFYNFPKR